MRKLRAFLVPGTLAAYLGLVACGGDPPPPVTGPDPVPPPAPMVVVEGAFGLPFSDEFIAAGRREFTTSSTGTLEVTVDWTDSANTVDVVLTRGACTFEQINADQCDVASFTRGTEPKPRRVTLGGQPAGIFTLFIGNVGPGDESISFQVVHTAAAGSTSRRHRKARPQHVLAGVRYGAATQ